MREMIDQQNMSDTEQADAPVQVITAKRNLKSQPITPGDDTIAQRKRGTTGSKT